MTSEIWALLHLFNPQTRTLLQVWGGRTIFPSKTSASMKGSVLSKLGSSPISWECLFLVARVDAQVPGMMPRPDTAYGHREPLLLDCEMLKWASGLGTGLTPVHHLNSFPFSPFLALKGLGALSIKLSCCVGVHRGSYLLLHHKHPLPCGEPFFVLLIEKLKCTPRIPFRAHLQRSRQGLSVFLRHILDDLQGLVSFVLG